MTENPLELYESVEGWQEASNDILAVIKIARREYQSKMKDADEAYKEVNAVLRKYEPWGSGDTEPTWHSAKIFCRGFPELDPDDFYA